MNSHTQTPLPSSKYKWPNVSFLQFISWHAHYSVTNTLSICNVSTSLWIYKRNLNSVRNTSFSENFVNVLNEWFLTEPATRCSKIESKSPHSDYFKVIIAIKEIFSAWKLIKTSEQRYSSAFQEIWISITWLMVGAFLGTYQTSIITELIVKIS